MGGFSSGRHRWRPHIESAIRLELKQLLELGALVPGEHRVGSLDWRDNGGRPFASIEYEADLMGRQGKLTLRYECTDRDGSAKDVECVIALNATPLNFGGQRWWMQCPYTHRKALKLHKFTGVDFFCHRTAIRPLPTYRTQRLSKGERILHRRWAIRKKLGDPGCLLDPLMKPEGMRWKTFERYDQMDRRLDYADAVRMTEKLGLRSPSDLDDLMRE